MILGRDDVLGPQIFVSEKFFACSFIWPINPGTSGTWFILRSYPLTPAQFDVLMM
jgi:hypothetical protein